ncbi:RidA family protein [Catenisphaera adipataccumulans]|jgi:enamine deaminase RidA (YjgF/YER057c/UK114 family)|uniref:Enamine deaminase RidA (YjgF/YER057c/UK114 family) n=1 Tax=Catenisphaera adipataccumulans TaxID=700500 RepID=A0A7W8FXJ1_9FIRM|nr:RidA family protein [Catenisphaera adipataccumulans]MBB5182992.1 enamine deaminase RidA (YjgF/YER057c/UK114 family) [Catenisphaera adipataccumulans]
MKYEQKIKELGIDLPAGSEPKAMYIPVKQVGNLLFISGQLPAKADGSLLYEGKLGSELTLEQGQECARLCIVNMLAAVKFYLGDLDRVKNVVKVQAFVASKTGFDQQHLVTNGASQLLFDVFGEAGKHARTAVGINQLPMNSPVEVEAIFEVE